jgi:hypothetical protein
MDMKIAVWDTYVERTNGSRMHFDILVPDETTDEDRIYGFGKQYLESKPFKTGQITSKECNFCHFENATDAIEKEIDKNGFYILEMENCN